MPTFVYFFSLEHVEWRAMVPCATWLSVRMTQPPVLLILTRGLTTALWSFPAHYHWLYSALCYKCFNKTRKKNRKVFGFKTRRPLHFQKGEEVFSTNSVGITQHEYRKTLNLHKHYQTVTNQNAKAKVIKHLK